METTFSGSTPTGGDMVCTYHHAVWENLGMDSANMHDDAATCTGVIAHSAPLKCKENWDAWLSILRREGSGRSPRLRRGPCGLDARLPVRKSAHAQPALPDSRRMIAKNIAAPSCGNSSGNSATKAGLSSPLQCVSDSMDQPLAKAALTSSSEEPPPGFFGCSAKP